MEEKRRVEPNRKCAYTVSVSLYASLSRMFLVHTYTLVAEFTVCSLSNSLPAENLSATPSRRQCHYPNRWWRVWNRFVSFYFARLQAGTMCNRISFHLTKVHLHGQPTKDKTSRHTHIKSSSSKNNLFIWRILTFSCSLNDSLWCLS